MISLPRKSEDGLDVVDSTRLTYFPITAWDIRVIAVLWTLFVVTSIFVILRLFSRIKILQFYSAEDYLYNIAFTLLLAYNAIITFYSYHGLGSQLPDEMTTSDITLAVVLENVLLDIASLGLIIAKSSLVVFIMRLIPQHQSVWKWRALLILPMLVLGIVSFGAMMAMWARCFTALAGTTLLCSSVIPAMHWMQITAGISIATDFWYASMPWYLLHRLQRPRREKLLIQGSMSLGVIAAGCGIARALTIYGALNNSEAQSAAVLYLWHGAEMAVTMICIGLPVCRPAYISIMTACGIQPRKANSSNRYGSYAGTYGLGRTIGSKYGEQTRGESDAWSQRRILADANVVSTRESYRLTSLSKTGITVTKTVDVVKQSPV